MGSLTLLLGQAEAQTKPKAERSTDQPTPIASNRPDRTTSSTSIPAQSPVLATIRVEGTPSPGLQVTLDGSGSSGGRVWYRWLQTQGPTVEIDGASKPQARFTVPTEVTSLGFVLVVGNASGVDAKAVTIEVEDPDSNADGNSFKADAGDDQTARVGRRVTLNGVRSEPRGKLRFRWVQSGGPKVVLKVNEGPTAWFVPSVPGTYQFALIVATSAGELSEPSIVTITVGGTIRASADAPPMAIDELARVSLSSIEGGQKYAEDLSRAFDFVADGIDKYKTFSETINETTRRLDSVVPRDKERRAVWIDQFFTPWMAKVVSGMKTEGIDLTQQDAQVKPLTRDQKARLADQFRYTATGLRASKTLR
jgi:hypothetical protein